MSLKETWLANVANVEKMNPGAVIINVTRSAGSVLSPSWALLKDYKAKKITWDGYIERFVKEMDNRLARDMMVSLGNLAKTKDVYLVCFERKGNCHRYLLVDMINRLTLGPEAPCIGIDTIMRNLGCPTGIRPPIRFVNNKRVEA